MFGGRGEWFNIRGGDYQNNLQGGYRGYIGMMGYIGILHIIGFREG